MEADLELLKGLQQEDPEFSTNMTIYFLEQVPDYMSDLHTHQEDMEQLRKAAHSFKGVCLNLGFQTLGDAIKELEYAAKNQEKNRIEAHIDAIEQHIQNLIPHLKAFLGTQFS